MKTEANETARPFHPEGYEPELGLTKREYFAATAMAGLNADPANKEYLNSAAAIAIYAVEQADDLIAALNAPKAQS